MTAQQIESLKASSKMRVQLQRERLRNENSLQSLVEHTSKIVCEPWQIKLCELLQKLPFQTGQRLAIKAPPQSGKTTTGAQRLPAFYLGHVPDARIRLLTYNERHSTKAHGVTLRNVMRSEYYRRTFKTRLPDDASEQRWRTAERESFADGQDSFAALGLQTGVVGGGAELYIFDDPYASSDDAFSDAMNETMRGIWSENIYPRLSPNDNIISLCHPWNERDFNSFLINDCGFTEIRIPSICDSENDFAGRPYIKLASEITYSEYVVLSPSERLELERCALTPRQPLESLLKMRDGYTDEAGHEVAGVGMAVFESLHQGRATAREGRQFQKEDFKYVPDFEHVPDSLFISYWDLGGSDDSKRDRTTNWLLHKTPGKRFTFVECDGFRLRKAERNARIVNTERMYRQKYKDMGMMLSFVEWQMGTAVEVTEEIVRDMSEFGMYEDHVTKKLTERAQPLEIQMQNGNVRFLQGVCKQEVIDEFLGFPGAPHDDYISAAAGAYNCAAEYRVA